MKCKHVNENNFCTFYEIPCSQACGRFTECQKRSRIEQLVERNNSKHLCHVCGTRRATWRIHWSTDYMTYLCDKHLEELDRSIDRIIEAELKGHE